MREMNYWTNLHRRRFSRRTMLGASAKAGVGAAGLALVGCGGDDDDSAAADAGGAAAAAEAAAAAGDSSAAAAAAERAAAAAEEAAAAAAAAGDAGAAAVAEAAAAAAEAAAEAARDAGAAEAGAAAEAAAAAAAAAEDAAAAAREAAAAAAAGEDDMADEAPSGAFAGIDLEATIRTTTPADAGGLDQLRSGSHTNYISHQCVHDNGIWLEPDTNEVWGHLVTPEWVDDVTMSAAVTPAPFHDGSIFSAQDAVFTHERAGGIAEYHNGGETTDNPAGWTSARKTYGSQNWARSEAVDDRTWVVELNSPDAGFLVVTLTGAVVMISKAYTERVGDAEMDRAPMGTGAYRFVSHSDDENFIFERNDNHFNPLDFPVNVPHVPYHKRLEVLVRPEVQSRLAGLEAGEIDTVPSLGFSDAQSYLDDPDFNVYLQPAGAASVHNIYPNLNNPVLEDGSPNPFLDQRVRLAANLAINREAIIHGLLSGTEEQSLFTFSGAIGYPTPEQKAEVTFPYDPERARELLAEAGYPDGIDTTLHIHGSWGQLVDELSLVIQQDMATAGIRLTIKPWAAAEYFTDAAVRARPGEPGLWWFFANTNPDVGSMINCCVKPSGPYAVAPGSPKILDLVARQEVELDSDARKELITELFLEHAREATFIFLIEPKEAVITRGDINWPAGKVQRRAEALNFATQKLV